MTTAHVDSNKEEYGTNVQSRNTLLLTSQLWNIGVRVTIKARILVHLSIIYCKYNQLSMLYVHVAVSITLYIIGKFI